MTKSQLTVYKLDELIFIKSIDVPKIKPTLDKLGVTIHETQKGKYRGKPRHYIVPSDYSKFLLALSDNYIITIQ